MDDERMNRECGWVRLFHPARVQVTIPLHLENPISEAMADTLLASITRLVAAGFTTQPPGPEKDEFTEAIGAVVRRSKRNADGTETPLVDLYPPRADFRLLGKYLNSDADVQEFRAVTGLELESLPLYTGETSIERGRDPGLDSFVVTLPHPIRVIWKVNPRYESRADRRTPKRLFVRWVATTPVSSSLTHAEACAVACPLGTRSHPEYRGLPLGEVARMAEGRKILAYLAGDQYHPNGNADGRKAKAAAGLLLGLRDSEGG